MDKGKIRYIYIALCSLIFIIHSCTKDKVAQPVDNSTVSFKNDIYPVFSSTGHCSNSGCHGTDGSSIPPHMYSLDSAYTSLLRDTSSNLSGYPFVDTLNPANSFVYIKLTDPNPPDGGARMPEDGGYLSDEFTAKLLKWIEQGAHNN
jgi:hypothetical protein